MGRFQAGLCGGVVLVTEVAFVPTEEEYFCHWGSFYGFVGILVFKEPFVAFWWQLRRIQGIFMVSEDILSCVLVGALATEGCRVGVTARSIIQVGCVFWMTLQSVKIADIMDSSLYFY